MSIKLPVKLLFSFIGMGFVVLSPLSHADRSSTLSACQPEWLFEPQALPKNQTHTEAFANQVWFPRSDYFKFKGDAEFIQPDRILKADRLKYDKTAQTAHAFGKVQLQQDDVILSANQGYFDQKNQTARLSEIRYQLLQNRSHGRADVLTANQKRQQLFLYEADFTTCPIVKSSKQRGNQTIETTESVDWQLDFKKLKIDELERRAYGYHTVVRFHDVPIFYIPYIDFPLDDRASGFLFPSFATYNTPTRPTLEQYISIPYFFNLAPNFDDTLTLTQFQTRGLMVENEFRYLQPKHQGKLTLTGINDKIIERQGLTYLADSDVQSIEGDSQRWRLHFVGSQKWAKGLTSQINWQDISDPYFYKDYPNYQAPYVATDLNKATAVKRDASVRYQNGGFQSQLSLVDYLRLGHDAPYNYELRPSLAMSYGNTIANSGVNYLLNTEATEFDIRKAGHNKQESLRTYLNPVIGYQKQVQWGAFDAQWLGHRVNYTHRDTRTNGFNDDEMEQVNWVSQYKLGGGLIFERYFDLNEAQYIQTLEPKVQYLNTPYVAQFNRPIFDTGERSLDFNNIFATNRFTGFDRIGDTEQVTLSLVSQLLTDAGEPLLSTGIGQIRYFKNRLVNLNNTDPEALATLPDDQTQVASDYYLKLDITLPKFQLGMTSQNQHDNLEKIVNAQARMKVIPNRDFTFLLTAKVTHYDQPEEQKDLISGLRWQLNGRWQLGTYWDYNWTQDINNDISAAARYDDCCWASELTITREELEPLLYNYRFNYMVEFKGLSTLGRSFTDSVLSKLNF